MIRGAVNNHEAAVVRLRFRGPKGAETEQDVVIDTGFNEALTLPQNVVGFLDLDFHVKTEYTLAHGIVKELKICKVEVEWDGSWRDVYVTCSENLRLMGMRLLDGHRLTIDVQSGGAVEITPLP